MEDYPYYDEERFKAIKNMQAKIYAKYMTLAILCFVPSFIAIFGVELYNKYVKEGYKNVVLEKNKNELWIEDIKTKEQRVLEFLGDSHKEELSDIHQGDTVEVRTHRGVYSNKTIVVDKHVRVITNYKLQKHREQQRLVNEKVKKMQKEK